VADAEDQDEQAIIFDLADETVIANAVFPELAEIGAVQGLADAAGIVQLGKPVIEKFQDTLTMLPIEVAQFAVHSGR
jgi:hypothetical protein